jgi:hypothetical protein
MLIRRWSRDHRSRRRLFGWAQVDANGVQALPIARPEDADRRIVGSGHHGGKEDVRSGTPNERAEIRHLLDRHSEAGQRVEREARRVPRSVTPAFRRSRISGKTRRDYRDRHGRGHGAECDGDPSRAARPVPATAISNGGSDFTGKRHREAQRRSRPSQSFNFIPSCEATKPRLS